MLHLLRCLHNNSESQNFKKCECAWVWNRTMFNVKSRAGSVAAHTFSSHIWSPWTMGVIEVWTLFWKLNIVNGSCWQNQNPRSEYPKTLDCSKSQSELESLLCRLCLSLIKSAGRYFYPYVDEVHAEKDTRTVTGSSVKEERGKNTSWDIVTVVQSV